MSNDLSAALSNLGRAANLLNDLTDQATDAVHRVEKLLNQFSIGIPASVNFGRRREESKRPIDRQSIKSTTVLFKDLADVVYNDHRSLEYRKVGKEKQFRIVVRDFDNALIGWDELPRDIKIQAVTALPSLINTLAAEVGTRINHAETALRQVSNILQDQDVEDKLDG